MARKGKGSQLSLGLTVRDLREENGMSQATLAATAKVSPGYLSQIENDEVQNPSAAVLFRLAEALQTDPRLLLRAAGYGDILSSSEGGEEDRVNPVIQPLLELLTRWDLERQRALLEILKGGKRRGRRRKSNTGAGR